MLKFITTTFLCTVMLFTTNAQEPAPLNFRNFPLIISLQFHNISMPFRDIRSHFKNIGFGIGTEVSHNGEHNWVQQFRITWIRNRNAGNAWMLSTHTVWRPGTRREVYGELNAGIGWMIARNPSESYRQVNGEWIEAGKPGKSMLVFPVGFGAGYHSYSPDTYYAGFAGYQLLFVKGYNMSIPVMPQSLLQAGAGIHPNY